MARFQAWWEESFDGLSNCGVLVVSDSQESEDSEESHPLVGGWDSEQALLDSAAKLGIPPSEIVIL